MELVNEIYRRREISARPRASLRFALATAASLIFPLRPTSAARSSS